MKTTLKTLALVLLTLSLAYANPAKTELNKKALTSLLKGIESENTGVKKNAIYLAGKYKLVDAVECLTEELKDEKDASTRLLIALALYQIGTSEGMKEVKYLAKYDENKEVRRMSNAIVEEYNSTMLGAK